MIKFLLVQSRRDVHNSYEINGSCTLVQKQYSAVSLDVHRCFCNSDIYHGFDSNNLKQYPNSCKVKWSFFFIIITACTNRPNINRYSLPFLTIRGNFLTIPFVLAGHQLQNECFSYNSFSIDTTTWMSKTALKEETNFVKGEALTLTICSSNKQWVNDNTTWSVQSTPAGNTRKRVWQYIEKEKERTDSSRSHRLSS